MEKLLVVDDEIKIVEMIEQYLQSEGFITLGITKSEEVLEKIDSFSPDLIILDVLMPGKNGFEILKEIRKKGELPVILLTAKSEEVDKVLGLEIGADDYITKPFSLRELVARIRVVLRRLKKGEKEVQEPALVYNHLTLYTERMEVEKEGKKIALTPTEYKLLEILARHPKRVFTRMQLLETLGEAYMGYERVLDTHISNLRRKIEEDPSHPRYILTVYGVGYKFGGDG
ncbi:Transcriptional regulatory protein WalR [[Clostridium] ultunense Esp]|uniref:response regulator transcription factor n=1 Tax=Thermicanus aegyptius TaxID=94009 RepID=UPI0002B6FB69|nr:response regulator transcription factor [Thermicanus aegyptius]CCQ96370.1 Transcriptional regulatory protein WalR [[Clostridium] ultunense Esp]